MKNPREMSGVATILVCVGFTALMVANWYFYATQLLGW